MVRWWNDGDGSKGWGGGGEGKWWKWLKWGVFDDGDGGNGVIKWQSVMEVREGDGVWWGDESGEGWGDEEWWEVMGVIVAVSIIPGNRDACWWVVMG